MTEKFNCERCLQNEQIAQKQNFCYPDVSSPRALFGFEYGFDSYEFYNCPKKFITNSTHSFYKRYRYQKDFPSAPMPDYESVNSRWISAYTLYEQKLSEFERTVFDREIKKK